jgi:hypothetical protein
MKKTILMAVLLAGTFFAGNASAATTTVKYGTFNINVSPDIGSGTFGTITVTDLLNGTARVTETITDPNFIINSGNHTPLTSSPYSIDTSPFTNPPFSDKLSFNAGIDGPGCTGGSSPGCGTTLSFIIDGYGGVLGQDYTSGGVTSTIFFATDLSNPTRGVTGAAGATLATPIPPAVALFGLGLAGIGLLKRATKKRNAPLGVA